MIKFLLLNLISFILSSCGQSYSPSDKFYEPELVPFLNDFLMEASSRGVGVDLSELRVIKYIPLYSKSKYVNLSDTGLCVEVLSKLGDWKEVWIVQHTFQTCTERSLLYHEFGHCLLGQGHRPGIMAPSLPNSEENCQSSWDEDLEELFNFNIDNTYSVLSGEKI